MAEEYTKEQLAAIESRDGSVLVGAAAGSGKTTVLSERITQMLADESCGLDASRILVLTFSSAATVPPSNVALAVVLLVLMLLATSRPPSWTFKVPLAPTVMPPAARYSPVPLMSSSPELLSSLQT